MKKLFKLGLSVAAPWASAAWEFVSGLPKWVYAVLIGLAFIWWYGGMQYDRGYNKRTAEYAEIARIAAVKANKADKAALVAVDAKRGAVEAENTKAREAAEGSDDRLKSALDAL